MKTIKRGIMFEKFISFLAKTLATGDVIAILDQHMEKENCDRINTKITRADGTLSYIDVNIAKDVHDIYK